MLTLLLLSSASAEPPESHREWPNLAKATFVLELGSELALADVVEQTWAEHSDSPTGRIRVSTLRSLAGKTYTHSEPQKPKDERPATGRSSLEAQDHVLLVLDRGGRVVDYFIKGLEPGEDVPIVLDRWRWPLLESVTWSRDLHPHEVPRTVVQDHGGTSRVVPSVGEDRQATHHYVSWQAFLAQASRVSSDPLQDHPTAHASDASPKLTPSQVGRLQGHTLVVDRYGNVHQRHAIVCRRGVEEASLKLTLGPACESACLWRLEAAEGDRTVASLTLLGARSGALLVCQSDTCSSDSAPVLVDVFSGEELDPQAARFHLLPGGDLWMDPGDSSLRTECIEPLVGVDILGACTNDL